MHRRKLLVLGFSVSVLAGCGTGDQHRRAHNATDAAPEAAAGSTGSGGSGAGGAGGASDAGTGGSLDGGTGGVRDATADVSSPSRDGATGFDGSTIDASNDATADAVSDARSCSAPAGAVDQQQLLNDGYLGLSTNQVIGQSFTAAATGQLTGIEVPLSWYYCAPPTQTITGSIQLTLTDGVTPVLTKDISFASFGSRCSNVALASGAPGVFYIDLSSACVQVVSGKQYTFTFTPLVPPGACNGTTCTAGLVGNTCNIAQECNVSFGLGEQSSGDPYPGGTAFNNGSPIPTIDLNFRTFVH